MNVPLAPPRHGETLRRASHGLFHHSGNATNPFEAPTPPNQRTVCAERAQRAARIRCAVKQAPM